MSNFDEITARYQAKGHQITDDHQEHINQEVNLWVWKVVAILGTLMGASTGFVLATTIFHAHP